jgi:hypothetical protein
VEEEEEGAVTGGEDPSWTPEIWDLRRRGYLRPRFLVARELLACSFRGERLPSPDDLAARSGVAVAGLPRIVEQLRHDSFKSFPHAIDERQQELDAQFSRREDWPDRRTRLRRLFRDRMEFQVAREFLAGVISERQVPTNTQVADRGKLGHGAAAAHRDAVLEKGADLMRVDIVDGDGPGQ